MHLKPRLLFLHYAPAVGNHNKRRRCSAHAQMGGALTTSSLYISPYQGFPSHAEAKISTQTSIYTYQVSAVVIHYESILVNFSFIWCLNWVTNALRSFSRLCSRPTERPYLWMELSLPELAAPMRPGARDESSPGMRSNLNGFVCSERALPR